MNNIFPWQNEVWQVLAKNKETLGHALLLKGKKGTGKLEFAKSLAKLLLCEDVSTKNEACDNCPGCRWFEQAGHPDFYMIESEAISELSGEFKVTPKSENRAKTDNVRLKKKPSKQISVAQIRSLGDVINMSSHRGGYKIIVIHPAETMNVAAANALLKNLEEPPSQTLYMLITHRPHDLLPTIRSRCRQITMPAPNLDQAINWLEQQGIKDAKDSLAMVGYAPLTVLEYNNSEHQLHHKSFISNISSLENFNPLLTAEELQKYDLPTVVNWLQKWCYDLISFRTTGKIRYYLSMQHKIKEMVPNIDIFQLAGYLRNLISMQRLAHHPLNPRLFLEEILISYAMLMAPARKKITDRV